MFHFKNAYVKGFIRKRLLLLVIALVLVLGSAAILMGEEKKDDAKSEKAVSLYAQEEDYEQNPDVLPGTFVYDNITAMSDAFYRDADNVIYVFAQDAYGNIFVAGLDSFRYDQIMEQEWENDEYRLEGSAEALPQEYIKEAISFWNETYGDDMGEVTEGEFPAYFGAYYLNNVVDTEQSFVMAGVFVLFVMGFILLIFGIRNCWEMFALLLPVKEDLACQIDSALDTQSVEVMKKGRVLLTPTHLVSLKTEVLCVRYTDILWIYVDQGKFDSFRTSPGFKIFTKDGKYHTICRVKFPSSRDRDDAGKVWNAVVAGNPDVRVEYTKENIIFAQEYAQNSSL